jgi:hypothetical protein
MADEAKTTEAQPLLQHDRPCRECAHFRTQFMAGSYCRKKLMGVTPDMHVGYYARPAPGWPGLCFEEAPHA